MILSEMIESVSYFLIWTIWKIFFASKRIVGMEKMDVVREEVSATTADERWTSIINCFMSNFTFTVKKIRIWNIDIGPPYPQRVVKGD